MSGEDEFKFDTKQIIYVKVNEKVNQGGWKNILQIEHEDDLLVKWIDS